VKPKADIKTKEKHVSGNQGDMEESARPLQHGTCVKTYEGHYQTSSQRSNVSNVALGYAPAHTKQALSKTKDQNNVGNGHGHGHDKHEAKTNVNASPDNEIVEEAMDGLSLEGDDPDRSSFAGFSEDSDIKDSDADVELAGAFEDEEEEDPKDGVEENPSYASDADE
jgi:hypothetical protein